MQLRKHFSPVTVPFPTDLLLTSLSIPDVDWPLLVEISSRTPSSQGCLLLSAVALCLLFLLLLSPTSSRKVWYKCQSSEILLVFSIDDCFIHPHSFIFTSPETLLENMSPTLDFSAPVPTFMYSPIIPYPGLVVRI